MTFYTLFFTAEKTAKISVLVSIFFLVPFNHVPVCKAVLKSSTFFKAVNSNTMWFLFGGIHGINRKKIENFTRRTKIAIKKLIEYLLLVFDEILRSKYKSKICVSINQIYAFAKQMIFRTASNFIVHTILLYSPCNIWSSNITNHL